MGPEWQHQHSFILKQPSSALTWCPMMVLWWPPRKPQMSGIARRNVWMWLDVKPSPLTQAQRIAQWRRRENLRSRPSRKMTLLFLVAEDDVNAFSNNVPYLFRCVWPSLVLWMNYVTTSSCIKPKPKNFLLLWHFRPINMAVAAWMARVTIFLFKFHYIFVIFYMILVISISLFHHHNIIRKHFPSSMLLYTRTCSTYKTGERGKIAVTMHEGGSWKKLRVCKYKRITRTTCHSWN